MTMQNERDRKDIMWTRWLSRRARSLMVRWDVLVTMMGSFFFVFGLLGAAIPTVVLADQQLPTMTVGYQSGKITAVYQTTFQIDGRTYSLAADAVILSAEGGVVDMGSFLVNVEVKYHVQKEQSDKIDKIIISLPR